MKDFNTASYLSQVRYLRKMAEAALKKYPIKHTKLKFINHGENTTFKVFTDKQHYLLRIHRKNYHTKEAILEEINWLKQLSEDSKFIQKPILSKNQALVEEITTHNPTETRYCSLMTWEEGILKYKSLKPKDFYHTGKLSATLHQQAKNQKVKHRIYWDLKGLLGDKAKFGPLVNLKPALTKKQYEIVGNCRKMVFQKIEAYHRKYPEKSSLIHADLHFGNIVWRNNTAIPIDFDDCGFGFQMYDLAIPISGRSKMFEGKKQQIVEQLFEGYATTGHLTQDDIDILPFFTLTRSLVMLGWLYDRRDNPVLLEYFNKGIKERVGLYKKALSEGPAPLY